MKKKFKEYLSLYRILALFLTVIIVGFSFFVFFVQTTKKGKLEKAKIVEVLQIQDDQGLIYQNFLISLGENLQVPISIPLNLPETSSLKVGDYIYVQKVEGDSMLSYRYASSDRTMEFLAILLLFMIILFVVLGSKSIKSIYTSVVFLTLVISGVFTINSEIRYAYFSIIGFMTILSMISVLWLYQDLVLSIISAVTVSFSLLFSSLLYILLINFTRASDIIEFTDLLGRQSLIYDYNQARLLASMIFVYGVILNLVINIIKNTHKYLDTHKKATRFTLIKSNVELIQTKISQMLNLIFFLALGLNFLGLVSEDYSNYKFIWNNSFFLGVMIDGIVVAVTLIVMGYLTVLFTSIYLHKRSITTTLH